MCRFVFDKPSKMFSKHYDDGNRDIRFSQNGNYRFKIFLQEIKTENRSLQKLQNLQCQSVKEELNNELLNIDINDAELVEFTSTVLSVLDKHAPIKRKYIRANNSAFMTK